MQPPVQFGVLKDLATVGWESCARLALRVFDHLQSCGHRTALGCLVGVSAAAGALTSYMFRRIGAWKSGGESTAGELEMLRAVVANFPDPIFVKDVESRFLLANQAAAENMWATNSAELLGKTDFDFFPKELASSFFEDEQKVRCSGRPLVSREEKIKDPNGSCRYLLTTKIPLLDAAGHVTGIIGIGRNITALKVVESELKRARDALEFKATHDGLTSLLNRAAILEMLEHELARSIRENGRVAVLLTDLDHFKNINDTHGHLVGDEVLKEVANRLVRTVRSYDLVGRYGGEEFLVVLPGCGVPDALARADHLRRAIAESPIQTAKGPISITLSIGVIVAEEWEQLSNQEVLLNVDAALYAAKAAGRNCCHLAEPSLGNRARTHRVYVAE
jgi:diguanylate cyclase (GGDEF)-like protein/PAS domain S-box-containing protein